MKVFKVLLILVTAFIAAVFIGGFMAPEKWQGGSKAVIPNTPPQKVMATVADLSTWPEWTALNVRDYPNVERQFSANTTGVGAYMTWDDGATTGKIKVTELTPARMEYLVSIKQKDNGGRSNEQACHIEVKPIGTDSEISQGCWGYTGSSPVNSLLLSVFKPRMVKQEFDKGLANLKATFAN